jgi:hypothetical protein
VLPCQSEICLRLKAGAKALCADAEHYHLLVAACLYSRWTVRQVALCRCTQVLHQDPLDKKLRHRVLAVLSLLHGQSHAQQMSSYLLERSTLN